MKNENLSETNAIAVLVLYIEKKTPNKEFYIEICIQ